MRKSPRRVRRDESGVAMVYLALTLVVLMIFASFAVDIGNARQQKADGQAGVDSAALSGAQVLDSKASPQIPAVFNMAATTTFKSLGLSGYPTSPTGSCGATCDDYVWTQDGKTYDIQVTTPFTGPGEAQPDATMLNVRACWGVPTTFAKVLGYASIPICTTATAQNGGFGGSGGGGCGTSSDITNITNTFTSATPQKITATYDTTGSNKSPLDTSKIQFVVQAPYGNFIQLAAGPPYDATHYQLTGSGDKVTISYTLPASIDTSGNTQPPAVVSNTFSADLQVIDTAGQSCGNASWSTGNQNGRDPIFDGGYAHDVSSNGLTSGTNEAWELPGGNWDDKPLGDGDGHDVNSDMANQDIPVVSDSDDTVWPVVGTQVSAGTPIGAIYNDENPLRAASVQFVVDGVTVPYDPNFGPNTFTFVDPSTVSNASPTIITGMPSFGTVYNTPAGMVSTVSNDGNGNLRLTLYDQMQNPMPGYTITLSPSWGGTQTSHLDGTATYTGFPPNGTYTASYSRGADSGSFKFTISGGTTISGVTPKSIAGSPWPAVANTRGRNQTKLPYGGSVGIMYNSTNLKPGWHAAVLFANDGDVNVLGGDCGLVAWAFSTKGTLHLVM
jgi:hypothetical protein